MAVKTSENVLVLWFFPIVKTAVKRMQSSKLEQLRYTLTKIVRTFWLAERPVFMRVCKHSCDVKMFCCALANHASIEQARIWKRFLIWEVYNIYPFPHRLKPEKSLQTHCVNFFRLSWYFKREKSVLWKASFLQNKNWLRARNVVNNTSRPARISLFIIAISKDFCFFFLWKVML